MRPRSKDLQEPWEIYVDLLTLLIPAVEDAIEDPETIEGMARTVLKQVGPWLDEARPQLSQTWETLRQLLIDLAIRKPPAGLVKQLNNCADQISEGYGFSIRPEFWPVP